MDESDETYITRLEAAIEAASPEQAAHAFAIELRDGGMPQDRLLRIFDIVRTHHRDDSDERRCDAVMDAMDCIVGWWAPHAKLYP